MTSEALQILNLSPIPEISEMELSTVLEQLSGVSDLNGEVSDRNVEDILREAAELIDMNPSVQVESFGSKASFKNDENSSSNCRNQDDNNRIESSENVKLDDSGTANDILNLSLCSDDNSQKMSKTSRNELDSPELSSARSSRSMTNHIQSTLNTLRECSKMIEIQVKSPPGNVEKPEEVMEHIKGGTNVYNEEKGCNMVKESDERPVINSGISKLRTTNSKNLVLEVNGGTRKDVDEKKKNVKMPVKGLNLKDSMKTLDCFERLYRNKPVKSKIDNKKEKSAEKGLNDKKVVASKVTKSFNPSKYELMYKERRLRDLNCMVPPKQNSKPRLHRQMESKPNMSGRTKKFSDNLTDEDVSVEKCLKLLNEESESQSNATDASTFNYTEFAEKMLKQYNASVRALQGEIEELRSQLKKNSNKEPSANWSANFGDKLWSQENLVQILKEENSKLFKEIEEIKEQLKMCGGSGDAGQDVARRSAAEKVESVEKLRCEVENLRRSLITAYSESNGISRLEEQFAVLKEKYDQQIGKLESENKKLRDTLSLNQGIVLSNDRKCEFQAESDIANVSVQTDWDDTRHGKDLTRSVSLESCRTPTRGPRTATQYHRSCESVDVGTSPIHHYPDRELCSVSVQCMGEADAFDADSPLPAVKRRDPLLENKENSNSNVTWKKGNAVPGCQGAKTRPILISNPKQRKVTEHENQLMVTLRALHSEITVKDRDNKKMRHELESLKSQMRRLTGTTGAKCRGDGPSVRRCHAGTQTIGLFAKVQQEVYDPAAFQVSKELEDENEELRSKVSDLECAMEQLKEKRVQDLRILQKLHEEEIEKLASRLNTQTALTNHLHSLLTGR